MIEPSAVFRRAPDVRYRVLDGEAVVLSQRRAEVLGLSEVGARLLDLCDGTRTFGEIVANAGGEFEVERERLERDAAGFFAELVEIGVLIRND